MQHAKINDASFKIRDMHACILHIANCPEKWILLLVITRPAENDATPEILNARFSFIVLCKTICFLFAMEMYFTDFENIMIKFLWIIYFYQLSKLLGFKFFKPQRYYMLMSNENATSEMDPHELLKMFS